jgi:peptide/nickel transport system permease protein
MGVVAVIVFLLLRLSPGDPAAIIAGDDATSEDIAKIREHLGLDRPLLTQFVRWIGQLATGDFGNSIYLERPVLGLIMERVEPTLALSVTTIIFAVVLAVPIGVLAAWRAGTWIDQAIMALSVLAFSVPVFLIGYGLVIGFSLTLELLPVQGFVSLSEDPVAFFRHLVLPTVALGLVYTALIARITRATMLETLNEDFIRTARAKGLPESRVVLKHALKNAFLPALSYLGPATALAMTGSFVVERVFTVPGLGQHFVNAVLNKDLFLIMGVVLVFSTLLILLNLAVDVLYRVVDPRIQD